ncbi:MAG: hydrogenase maturation nickel metallochaperone HypA [Rhodospirillales bacterium]|nr:hydrogenase maturation nickel metallochaperone HypA [Rhodospirillales bacterium]
MHEVSLCEGIIRIIEAEQRTHGFQRVNAVRIVIGAFSCAAPEALEFCFRTIARGTVADGAILDMVRIPGNAWCMNCGETVELTERYDCCPQCRTYELQVTGGDELRVAELEVA